MNSNILLTLKDIKKVYPIGDDEVKALKGVNLSFRENEFVSILGPSGCGKTTLLNIVGGLDRYTSGDILVDQVSTKDYKDADWDAYRNHRVGFVFQNYNLIPHMSVLGNVELALTISGVSKQERIKRAKQALHDVGLSDQLSKKPNQLSGGQMQRVAIARALVNDPQIILADEPTGALDSKTSVQVMEILKRISKNKLIIMVTHNPGLAEKYSERVIHLLDGEVQSDSRPVEAVDINVKPEKKKSTSMNFFTALRLSFNNLYSKRVRTIITALAGSIGIVGVGLVLSLYNGVNVYLDDMQRDALAGFPITISDQYLDVDAILNQTADKPRDDTGYIYPYIPYFTGINNITPNYLTFIERLKDSSSSVYEKYKDAYSAITYDYYYEPHFVIHANEMYSGSSYTIGEGTPFEIINKLAIDPEYFPKNFDIVAGEMPKLKTNNDGSEPYEALLMINKDYSVMAPILMALGIVDFELKPEYDAVLYEEILNALTYQIKTIPTDVYYQKEGSLYRLPNDDENEALFNASGSKEVKIVGIAKAKNNSVINISNGVLYLDDIVSDMMSEAKEAQITLDQINSATPIITLPDNDGSTDELLKRNVLRRISGLNLIENTLDATNIDSYWHAPKKISIYPSNFDNKELIKEYLDTYNESILNPLMHIKYIDEAAIVTSLVGQMVDMMTYVLVAFAAISLFVSSIMIGIITYVSVVERTKEIGILRSIGARKKDISRVFNAETIIIGFAAGVLGIVFVLALTPVISHILNNVANIQGLARFNIFYGLALILISMTLTLIAGLVPANIASKKDPVVALRTE